MSNGEDWLMRPVVAGMVGYESVVRPGLDLCDFADMNEALDCAALNSKPAPRGRP